MHAEVSRVLLKNERVFFLPLSFELDILTLFVSQNPNSKPRLLTLRPLPEETGTRTTYVDAENLDSQYEIILFHSLFHLQTWLGNRHLGIVGRRKCRLNRINS